MMQLELDFKEGEGLERKVNTEFSNINSVWTAFHYAEDHDPHPHIKYYGRYYVPRTVKEIKQKLKCMYPNSTKHINKMTSKQAKRVYHTLFKYLTS